MVNVKQSKYIFSLLILCFSGCTDSVGINKTYDNYANAMALIAKYNVIDSQNIDEIPQPKIGDKCQDCNNPPGECGIGRVGDGTTCLKCETCNGDGVIHEMDLSETISNDSPRNEIKMLTRDNCKYCNDWKAQVQPILKNKGWEIKPIVYDGAVPVFQFKSKDGKDVEHQGFMSVSQFSKLYEGK